MLFFCLVLVVCLLRTVSTGTHSLKYIYTAVSGDINLPEFTIVGLIDNSQFMYFDSNTQTAVPKTEWMKREGAEYWNSQSQISIEYHEKFKTNLQVAKDRFNQSTVSLSGVHTWMWMYGCEWDEETGATGGFDQYGYDGKDFISLDLNTLTWIAPTPQAVISKHKWDSNKASNDLFQRYFTEECINWLRIYVDYGRSSLMRTVLPSVSLLQKTPSSPVTCHATGFYPSTVMVTWQKDGQDLHEDVELGETLPNDDGTFQKSAKLNVNPEERKNNQYQCVVQVSGIKDVITVFTEKEPFPVGIIIGVGAAALVIVAAVVGVFFWKKNKGKKGFAPANNSDTDNSGQKT